MHLLGLLYISLQVRAGSADSLFEVENTIIKTWQSIEEVARNQIWCHAWKQIQHQILMKLV